MTRYFILALRGRSYLIGTDMWGTCCFDIPIYGRITIWRLVELQGGIVVEREAEDA